MKITKSQFKQIIKEELSKALGEDEYDIDTGVPHMGPEELENQKMEDQLERIADPEEQDIVRKVLSGELPHTALDSLSPITQGIISGRV